MPQTVDLAECAAVRMLFAAAHCRLEQDGNEGGLLRVIDQAADWGI